MEPGTTMSAVTHGIRVDVQSQYLAEHSQPSVQRYVFAYRIRISNESQRTVQLVSRHWRVTHGDGHVEEVQGLGVVGEQPLLPPGHAFEYSSGAVLRTPRGTMHGTYDMVDEKGGELEVEIPRFLLEMPYSLN